MRYGTQIIQTIETDLYPYTSAWQPLKTIEDHLYSLAVAGTLDAPTAKHYLELYAFMRVIETNPDIHFEAEEF